MWQKKKWIIVGGVIALVVVGAGITGGIAYAQSSGSSNSTTNNPGKALADRVADILKLDRTTVENAFAQAEKDMKNDAVKTYLDRLVQAGKMTQAEADKYLQWWQSRPQTPQGLNLPQMPGGKFMGPGGFPGMMGKRGLPPPPTATPNAK